MTQKAQAEINKFVAGMITDASPLTFPENASLVDINMELSTDGSRKRALGIDYEDDYTIVSTTMANAATDPLGFNSFKWENVGGDPDRVIVCVQFGNQVKFFDAEDMPMSANLIDTRNFSTSDRAQRFSFTSVDGKLIIVTGINLITVVEYASGVLSYKTDTIKVRDFFGVEDTDGGDDLTVGIGLTKRPTTLSTAHQYNLRNQGFATPRVTSSTEILWDPIELFNTTHTSVKGRAGYPSNADDVISVLYADAGDADDRNVRRYFAADSIRNPLGTTRAAQGYYIIDFLNRGSSRNTEDTKNHSIYPELNYTLGTLKQDKTPGGATVVGEFAGRVWYGGFSGEVIDGDSKSPRLSSYIAFSQLVSDPSMITRCYQDGDPTSDQQPDIIDTDGGYIRLNNAFGISALINLGKSLFVGGANGWWRIYGGNDSGFSATNYVVDKITEKGIRGNGTVVVAENTLLFWSDDGIYHIKPNQFGDWVAENQTQTRIQKFFNAIPVTDKESAIGVYDGYQKKVRWLYNNRLNEVKQQKELILDLNLMAFYERHISQVNGNNPPIVVGAFNTSVFEISSFTEPVTVGGAAVTVGATPIEVTEDIKTDAGNLYEIAYVVVTSFSPTVTYTFATYSDVGWVDWRSYNDVGVDAPATLITGTAHGGDTIRYKQVPYLIVHMIRTEDGFVADSEGDFVPTNQSSCMITSMWDWTNSVNSNKWGIPFEAYRYKRAYFPVNISDDFDTGYETVVTKNKLRGRGRAIALKFTSSPGKEMHILGWGLVLAVNDNI